MTKPRHDTHSTEFGLWLREQPEIDSSKGYRATNVDYVWRYLGTNQWRYIEEKRHGAQPKPFQVSIFKILDNLAKANLNYCGFLLITFQNTSPDDGKIWVSNDFGNTKREITKQQLIQLLAFQDA